VLGAGGFLGAAWSLGALSAMRDVLGWDPAQAGLMLGTSAGSVLAALLRAGHSVEALCAGQRRRTASARATQIPDTPALALDLDGEPSWPGLPRLGPGSVPLALRVARRPLAVSPRVLCAALLPRGRRPLTQLGALIGDVRWPDSTWVVALNYHTGARVPFGRPGSPHSSLARAVMASCAVPAWYEPVRIGQDPHVDGAVYSPCNADLLVDAGLDEVYVLAPMASVELDRPRTPLAWFERAWRRLATRRTLDEVERLRATGTRVRLLMPNAADLAVMGANMMDVGRRAEVLHTARASVLHQLRGGLRAPISSRCAA